MIYEGLRRVEHVDGRRPSTRPFTWTSIVCSPGWIRRMLTWAKACSRVTVTGSPAVSVRRVSLKTLGAFGPRAPR